MVPDKLLYSIVTHPITSMIQWETLFSKVSSVIDNLTLARGDSSGAGNLGFEIITANRLKLGRNNKRSLEGSVKRMRMCLISWREIERFMQSGTLFLWIIFTTIW